MIAARILMGVWLAIALIAPLIAAWPDRRLPFILALDRRQQRRVLLAMACGAALEIITLWVGGFWG